MSGDNKSDVKNNNESSDSEPDCLVIDEGVEENLSVKPEKASAPESPNSPISSTVSNPLSPPSNPNTPLNPENVPNPPSPGTSFDPPASPLNVKVPDPSGGTLANSKSCKGTRPGSKRSGPREDGSSGSTSRPSSSKEASSRPAESTTRSSAPRSSASSTRPTAPRANTQRLASRFNPNDLRTGALNIRITCRSGGQTTTIFDSGVIPPEGPSSNEQMAELNQAVDIVGNIVDIVNSRNCPFARLPIAPRGERPFYNILTNITRSGASRDADDYSHSVVISSGVQTQLGNTRPVTTSSSSSLPVTSMPPPETTPNTSTLSGGGLTQQTVYYGQYSYQPPFEVVTNSGNSYYDNSYFTNPPRSSPYVTVPAYFSGYPYSNDYFGRATLAFVHVTPDYQDYQDQNALAAQVLAGQTAAGQVPGSQEGLVGNPSNLTPPQRNRGIQTNLPVQSNFISSNTNDNNNNVSPNDRSNSANNFWNGNRNSRRNGHNM